MRVCVPPQAQVRRGAQRCAEVRRGAQGCAGVRRGTQGCAEVRRGAYRSAQRCESVCSDLDDKRVVLVNCFEERVWVCEPDCIGLFDPIRIGDWGGGRRVGGSSYTTLHHSAPSCSMRSNPAHQRDWLKLQHSSLTLPLSAGWGRIGQDGTAH